MISTTPVSYTHLDVYKRQVQDTARAKEILGATATLEFRLADEENDWNQAAVTGRAPLESRLYKDRNGRPVLLKKRVMLTGDSIVDASSGIDQQNGGPTVFVLSLIHI